MVRKSGTLNHRDVFDVVETLEAHHNYIRASSSPFQIQIAARFALLSVTCIESDMQEKDDSRDFQASMTV